MHLFTACTQKCFTRHKHTNIGVYLFAGYKNVIKHIIYWDLESDILLLADELEKVWRHNYKGVGLLY